MLNFKDWMETPLENCAQRTKDQTKVCQFDCDIYAQGFCYPSGAPVCGYSQIDRQCKLFYNLCSLKQDACKLPGTKGRF